MISHSNLPPQSRRWRFWPLALMLVLTLALANACGSSDEATADGSLDPNSSDSANPDSADQDSADQDSADQDSADQDSANGFPLTIDSAGGTWVLESAPQRIVSLSPMATESLFAIGAGAQVVAADAFSNYPPEAPTTELSGFDPNIEAILAFEPDLVVAVNDANEMVAALSALNIPVFISPAPVDIEDGYDNLTDLGLVAGRLTEADALVADLQAQIENALASAPTPTDDPIRVYHELDETHFSASSFGFVGAVYAEMGLENIADAADSDQTGFPQLTEEYIIEANPDLIIITDQVSYSAQDVANRPGWDQVGAVQANNIVTVNADTASRWGPRLPQFIASVVEALALTSASG